MTVKFITPVDIVSRLTYDTTTYHDVDISDLLPASATGAILHWVYVSGTGTWTINLRKNGSTDTLYLSYLGPTTHHWIGVGLDAGRIFEARTNDNPPGSRGNLYLVGYTQDETVWFTNPLQHTFAGAGAYEDIDISADTGVDTSIGVWAVIPSNTFTSSIRKNGSSDDRYVVGTSPSVVGVDGGEIFEAKISNVATKLLTLAYITKDAVFNTDAVDISLGSTGAYADLSALPITVPRGIAQIIELSHSSTNESFHVRKKGLSDDYYYKIPYHRGLVISDVNTSGIAEGKISATSLDFYQLGYFTDSTPLVSGYKSLKGVGL